MLPGTVFCENAYATMDGAAALAIVTEWNEFRLLDLERVKKLLSVPVMIDLRNIYKPDEIKRLALTTIASDVILFSLLHEAPK